MTDLVAPDLTITGLRKSFGPVTVLDGVDLHIRGGEFVGLMGPNGAGKSTLIKILGGVYSASGGRIEVGGRQVSHLTGADGVGFIHQDLGLVDDLSIAENLRLGEAPMRLLGTVLDHRAERAAAEQALAGIGLEVPVGTRVGDLSPGEKTLVAIARAFARGARILFVDEATSTLSPRDASKVIASLSDVVQRGVTVVMVSHKLGEILAATQRVVLLLDGRIGADQSTQGMGRSDLVRLLAQHEHEAVEQLVEGEAVAHVTGEPLLELRGAQAGRAGPVDLTLHAGEVIGLTGLPGSGLHDIAYLAHGVLRPEAGERILARGARSAFVPPHRETQGGFPALTVRDNLTITAIRRWRGRHRLLSLGAERSVAAQVVDDLSVLPRRPEAEFGTLSGGNKQKVIFGRALLTKAQVYVLCEPTRGVDIAARADIYKLIRSLRRDGAAVLVVSSDAEDLFAVCDRLAVVMDGSLTKPRAINEVDAALMEELL
ncbi:sugar ABC transporter ATP-binding protein [soil metagenome]